MFGHGGSLSVLLVFISWVYIFILRLYIIVSDVIIVFMLLLRSLLQLLTRL